MSDAPFSPPTPPSATPADGAGAEDRLEGREMARRVATAQARAQAAADAALFGAETGTPTELRYPGLVTRAIGLTIDALIINAVAVITGASLSLIFGIFNISLPSGAKTLAAAVSLVVYALWLMGYFVGFWSSTGQTIGGRVMQLRVVPAEDPSGRIPPRRALLRLIGLGLGLLMLGLGELLVLVDDKRRALQDRLARTLVVDAPVLTAHDVRRLEREGAEAVIETSANVRRP